MALKFGDTDTLQVRPMVEYSAAHVSETYSSHIGRVSVKVISTVLALDQIVLGEIVNVT